MRAIATALLLLCALAPARFTAAEETTDAERLYFEMRHSDDRITQLMGERWYGLVKLQEWTDATGKFHTTAKYLAHDPDMKWVKLLAVKGSGEERITKELTIPVEKLDKRCQSRVRQIEALKSKVEAAAAKEAADAKTDEHHPSMEMEGERSAPRKESHPGDAERKGRAASPEETTMHAPANQAAIPIPVPLGIFFFPNLGEPWPVLVIPPAEPPAADRPRDRR